jgi:hypothetical protein
VRPDLLQRGREDRHLTRAYCSVEPLSDPRVEPNWLAARGSGMPGFGAKSPKNTEMVN